MEHVTLILHILFVVGISKHKCYSDSYLAEMREKLRSTSDGTSIRVEISFRKID